MVYIHSQTNVTIKESTVLSLGKFDGFHIGHKLLLEQVIAKKRVGLKAAIFTFDLPPKALINGHVPQILLTNQEKRHLLEDSGIDYLIEYPFTQEIREMEAEVFIRFLVEHFSVKCIVTGADFRFGYQRSGTPETLRDYSEQYGYETILIEKKRSECEDISSTRIRQYILGSHMEEANQLLGYDYFLIAKVVHGRRLGRTLGIPTINQLPPPEKLLPPPGIYVSRITIDSTVYGGVTNIGHNPTVEGGNPLRVETNIFDFSGDLYGKELQVHFLKFLRSEIKFDSIEALQKKMEDDIQNAKEWLEKNRGYIRMIY